jgi:hypothetical protein
MIPTEHKRFVFGGLSFRTARASAAAAYDAGRVPRFCAGVLGSGDEDILPVPVEVLAGGRLGTWRKEQRLT